MTCERCGIIDGDDKAHECLPNRYAELERITDEERAIEVEARLRGIHPYELIRERHQAQKDADRAAAEAQRDALCAVWGMSP